MVGGGNRYNVVHDDRAAVRGAGVAVDPKRNTGQKVCAVEIKA